MRKHKRHKFLSEQSKSDLVFLAKKGASRDALSRRYKVCDNTVKNILREAGVKGTPLTAEGTRASAIKKEPTRKSLGITDRFLSWLAGWA